MIRESGADVREARRQLGDTLVLSYVDANGEPLATPERAHVGLFPPYLAEKKSWCVYYTYVSGVLFMLNVGKSTGFGPKNLCIWNNPDRPILVSGVLLDKFEAMVKEKLQSSKHTQSFLAEMEEVAKKKQTMS